MCFDQCVQAIAGGHSASGKALFNDLIEKGDRSLEIATGRLLPSDLHIRQRYENHHRALLRSHFTGFHKNAESETSIRPFALRQHKAAQETGALQRQVVTAFFCEVE